MVYIFFKGFEMPLVFACELSGTEAVWAPLEIRPLRDVSNWAAKTAI